MAGAVPAHAKGKSGKARSAPAYFAVTQTQHSLEGKIARFLLNPHGEVDGFLLDDDVEVKWPPHLGEELVKAFAPGADVLVTGFYDHRGNFKVYQIQGKAGGPVLQHQPPTVHQPRHPRRIHDMPLQALTVAGQIELILPGPRGEPRLIVLDSGAQVHVPPHSAWLVNRLVSQPGEITVEGYGMRSPHGVVLRATVITPAGEAPVTLYAQPVR
jgi:hypothetical protein